MNDQVRPLSVIHTIALVGVAIVGLEAGLHIMEGAQEIAQSHKSLIPILWSGGFILAVGSILYPGIMIGSDLVKRYLPEGSKDRFKRVIERIKSGWRSWTVDAISGILVVSCILLGLMALLGWATDTTSTSVFSAVLGVTILSLVSVIWFVYRRSLRSEREDSLHLRRTVLLLGRFVRRWSQYEPPPGVPLNSILSRYLGELRALLLANHGLQADVGLALSIHAYDAEQFSFRTVAIRTDSSIEQEALKAVQRTEISNVLAVLHDARDPNSVRRFEYGSLCGKCLIEGIGHDWNAIAPVNNAPNRLKCTAWDDSYLHAIADADVQKKFFVGSYLSSIARVRHHAVLGVLDGGVHIPLIAYHRHPGWFTAEDEAVLSVGVLAIQDFLGRLTSPIPTRWCLPDGMGLVLKYVRTLPPSPEVGMAVGNVLDTTRLPKGLKRSRVELRLLHESQRLLSAVAKCRIDSWTVVQANNRSAFGFEMAATLAGKALTDLLDEFETTDHKKWISAIADLSIASKSLSVALDNALPGVIGLRLDWLTLCNQHTIAFAEQARLLLPDRLMFIITCRNKAKNVSPGELAQIKRTLVHIRELGILLCLDDVTRVQNVTLAGELGMHYIRLPPRMIQRNADDEIRDCLREAERLNIQCRIAGVSVPKHESKLKSMRPRPEAILISGSLFP